MRKHPIILLAAVILFPNPSFSQFIDVNEQTLSLVSRSDGTKLTHQLTEPVSLQTTEAGSDVGTQLLIPSSAHTSSFTSLLVILNLGSQTNNVRITARRPDGSTLGITNTSIPVGGSFRSQDVLGQMGAALGDFGPITVESTNGVSLSAVSEVSSSQGPGGFFPGINTSSAALEVILAEIVDTGNAGEPGTFRTNIGINCVNNTPADVTITALNSSGSLMGSTTRTVPANGLVQINSVLRELLNSAGAVTGQNGYLRFSSNHPIIVWASKIENVTGDPSFQVGIRLDKSAQAWDIGVFKGEINQSMILIPIPFWISLAGGSIGSVYGLWGGGGDGVGPGGGEYRLDSLSDNLITLSSTVTFGDALTGTTTLRPQDNDTLQYNYSSGTGVTSSGILRRAQ